MCGQTGMFLSSPATMHDAEILSILAAQNAARGNRAYGILSTARTGRLPSIVRACAPLQQMHLPTTFLDAVVHTRAPTAGSASNLDEVHPYACEQGYLFMNGLLHGYAEDEAILAARKNYPSNSLVDTSYVAAVLEEGLLQGLESLPKTLARVARTFKGQQACIFVYVMSGLCLPFMWRCMAPLYWGKLPSGIVVSSTKSQYCEALLPEGYICQGLPWSRTVLTLEPFEFHSIYE